MRTAPAGGSGTRADPPPRSAGRHPEVAPIRARDRFGGGFIWLPRKAIPSHLKNLGNEAALRAARRGEDRVAIADLSDSLEKIVLGTARGIVLSPEERKRTAFHESGHALLRMLTPAPTRSARSRSSPAGSPSASPTSTPDRPVRRLRLPARPDHRRAGRPRRRGGHLRRRHHRRRERPRARQRHRPADGGPVVNVTGHRAHLGCFPARNHPRARTALPRPPESSSTPKPAGSSRNATGRPWEPARQPGRAGPAGPHAHGPGDPGRGRGVRRSRHSAATPPRRDRRGQRQNDHPGIGGQGPEWPCQAAGTASVPAGRARRAGALRRNATAAPARQASARRCRRRRRADSDLLTIALPADGPGRADDLLPGHRRRVLAALTV
jgi:hypothetical protein